MSDEADLTAYELQVLIGTTISGCNMSPDRVFDLPAAWARLRSLDLIDRTDGLAIATPSGVSLVARILSTLSLRSETRASVIEECARVADGMVRHRPTGVTEDEAGTIWPYGGEEIPVAPSKIATAIRALHPSGGDGE